MLCIRAEICNLCPVPSPPSLRMSSLSKHLSHSSSTNCVILSRLRSLSWQQAMEYRYNSCSVRLQYIPPDITRGIVNRESQLVYKFIRCLSLGTFYMSN